MKNERLFYCQQPGNRFLKKGLMLALLTLITFSFAYAQKILPEDKRDFLAFLDEVIEGAMKEYEVPNATFALVQGSEIYMIKGYGMANIELNNAVNPSTTLFRVASVSKSLTATAVITLADRGLIALDENVNRWLPHFKLKEFNGNPVTWHDLLTHSAGLDDKVYFPTYVENDDEYLSLEEAFSSSPPVQFTQPGKVIRYSNQGYALLGYLIEQVSGIRFEDYVKQYVFEPLEMQNSSFEQLLLSRYEDHLVRAYKMDEELGEFVQQPQIFVNEMPAGGMYTTAEDMAHYMLMHINKGKLDDHQRISSPMLAKMHQSQFSLHPHLGGYGYGFWHTSYNGHPILAHDGNGPSIASRLMILPEQNVGFFIAQQGGSNKSLLDISDKLLNKILGNVNPIEPTASEKAETYTGLYKDNRYVHKGYFKLPTRIGLELDIKAKGNNLVFTDPLEGIEREYVEIAPDLFSRLDRPEVKLAFIKDEAGKVSGIQSMLYHTALDFERVAWWETNTFLLILLIFPTIIFFLSTLIIPIKVLIRRLRKKTWTKPESSILWFNWVFSLLGFIIMAFFVLGDLSPLPFLSPQINAVAVYSFLTATLLVSIMAVGVTFTFFIAIRSTFWRWYGILGHLVLSVASLLFLVFSVYSDIFLFLP